MAANNDKSYIPLIEAWEQFNAENGEFNSLANFAEWILAQQNNKNQDELELDIYFENNNQKYNLNRSNSEAAFLLSRLAKFVKMYVKPIFSKYGLSSQDDFGIMAQVDFLKICSKKQAIEANLIDNSTGIEQIKRLVKQGLLLEKDGEADKRQKLIYLSEAGKGILYSIFQDFSNIPEVMLKMTEPEKNALVATLKKLDTAHTQLMTTK
jgi:DNA-binding MarR family transcriptional regulator